MYKADLFGSKELSRWEMSATDVQTETKSLDYASRSRASVRYVVKIVPGSSRLLERFEYDLTDLLTDAGAWAGMWALGLTVLTMLQKATSPFGLVANADAEAFVEHKDEQRHSVQVQKVERAFSVISRGSNARKVSVTPQPVAEGSESP